ncbi:MAG: PHP domain-containing protein, partial [Bacteroidia bacterium]
MIIRPDGYTIPFNAEQVHGISTARAMEEGKDLKTVLEEFKEIVDRCTYLCGHNIDFDINIIGAEFFRMGLPNAFEGKKSIDTKNDETTNFCALPGGRGGKFKWPTLTELYQKLFNDKFDEAHNAAFDVAATARVFFEIIKRGITRVNEIYADSLGAIMYQAPDLSGLQALEKSWKERKASEARQKTTEATTTTAATDLRSIRFSHLHNHTQFSVLQSTSDVEDIVNRAIEYGSPGVALTDHGNMYGAFLFWKEIDGQNKKIKEHNAAIDKGEITGEKKTELKCIIGCEVNICADHKDKSKKDNGFMQVLIAKNRKGYENLCRISSIGLIDGSYYVPRIDKDVLVKYKEGLIATTGSLGSEVPATIVNMGEQQGEAAFLWYKEQFGDDFYVELNRQYQTPDENYVNDTLLSFAKKYNVPYFAANNNYYIDKKGAFSRDIL